VLAGISGSEDAGVYRLDENTALIQTIDFFTPIVDDPRIFGRVAAANSLSDVYAMGGRPITALNVVCFPVGKLGVDALKEILAGGQEILNKAGVALIGGHSVDDNEPKYGLSVSGLVHPDKIMTNDALRPGDKLILTKAVGTGIIAAAIKGGLASPESVEAMVESMCALNREASEVAARFNVRACTDVTGFGLVGHLAEMARASRCAVRIDSHLAPRIEGAMEYASMGLIPAGTRANGNFFRRWVSIEGRLTDELRDLMFDPQTSGGLLFGVKPDAADALAAELLDAGVESSRIIGEVLDTHPEGHVEIV
jgi:selenide,water dikinase